VQKRVGKKLGVPQMKPPQYNRSEHPTRSKLMISTPEIAAK
jgi:hypothetical protein